MQENISCNLTFDTLAAKAGQTSRTFHRRFTTEIGPPPATFVERLRCDQARVLLEGERSVKEIALLCGSGPSTEWVALSADAWAFAGHLPYHALLGEEGLRSAMCGRLPVGKGEVTFC